jgi:predicted ATP-grasp superfamily ATP-dependent carboligase
MRIVSSPPIVLVHEFVIGGGWPGLQLPPGLAGEALAMLRAVLADFQSWGRVQILTTLDSRLSDISLTADRIINLSHEDYYRTMGDLLARSDAALIIAPESNGILARLTALVERSGAQLLGASSAGVIMATDKWECSCRFTENGLPTPDTWRSNSTDAIRAAKKLGFPLVVKPIDEAGCEAVSLASDVSSLNLALEHAHFQHRDFLLQRYVAGTHASASMLVSGQRTLPLSLNEQLINIGIPFIYQGGVVPLQHPQRRRALELARRAVSLIPGLKGYVGVDMVLTDEECFLIEINPRLTTSYVGLRQVININLAEAIWQASREDIVPQEVMISGKVLFHKEELSAI